MLIRYITKHIKCLPFVMRTALLFLIVSAGLMLSGCRYTVAPADLLQKPMITQEQAELASSLEIAMPKYSAFMLPMRDDAKEAIRLADLDGDGVKEAIVTYYNELSIPEIAIMKKVDGNWKQWFMIEQPLARGMEWLKLIDLNNDGKLELIVGWFGGFDSPSMLGVYAFDRKGVRNDKGKTVLQPAELVPYSYAEVGAIDKDNTQTLAVITEEGSKQFEDNTDSNIFNLTLYQWDGSRMKVRYEQPLYNQVNGYMRLLMGNLSKDKKGITAEASTGAHSTYTAMYHWDGKKLEQIYPMPVLDSNDLEFYYDTTSDDFDKDGIIELQKRLEAPGNEDLSYADKHWITNWLQWDGESSFLLLQEQLLNYTYGIQVDIPKEWKGYYTMSSAVEETHSVVKFEYWNEETRLRKELAVLYAIPQQVWSGHDQEWKTAGRSYKPLLIDSGMVYAVSFAAEPPTDLSEQDNNQFAKMIEDASGFAARLRTID